MASMARRIHKNAIVDREAELADGVEVGPYCVIGPGVSIGEGTRLISHVSVQGRTSIGRENEIHPFASIGGPPQDTKYEGGATRASIGDGNTIREYVTINTGTEIGGGITTIGDRNLLMAYAHVAHDCHLEDHCILANVTQLAGHVVVESGARMSGMCAIHQFVTLGTMSFVGGLSGVTQDIPPYMIAAGTPAVLRGPNREGLKRAGIDPDAIKALRKAWHILSNSDLDRAGALAEIQALPIAAVPEVKRLLAFLEEMAESPRGRKQEKNRRDRPSGALDPITMNALPDVAAEVEPAADTRGGQRK